MAGHSKFYAVLAAVVLIFLTVPLAARDPALFSSLLRKHTRHGLVRYTALKKDPRLPRYISQLAATNPNKIKGSRRQLAFWINAYNAYTLKLITENYPLKSITELHLGGSLVLGTVAGKTVWQTWKFKINKKEYTLDQIEHKIIRPRYKDARIHAALVCAAHSCPPLRAEAYEGKKLDKQLDQQMRQWLADRKRNRFDVKKKTLYLSKIFKWFKKDFTRGQSDIVKVLLPYFPAKTRQQIQKLDRKDIKIRYLKYNWRLNEA